MRFNENSQSDYSQSDTKVRNSYTAAVATAKNNYYQTRINEAEGNIKQLYRETSNLLGRVKDNPLPPHTSDVALANDFLRFFGQKIAKIRDELDNIITENSPITDSLNSPHVNTSFTKFNPLSEIEISKLVQESKSTTCELDVIPTPKLKDNLQYLTPVITEIVNRSLATGVFPQEWKNALIRPLLKKKGLSLELQNYRPVSNLSFLSKILEKAALRQITKYIEVNKLLPHYQSAYRKNHGVETAMLKMYSDLLSAIDNSQVTIVVMIDLSAAFDTVDIPTVIDILHDEFGIKDTPLKWVESYLTQRSVKVIIDNSFSDTEHLKFGVPQGSCAGPVIFTMYIAALKNIGKKYNLELYGYADDHKIAFRIQVGDLENEATVIKQLDECLLDIMHWMNQKKLKMNNSKTEIILYGTKQQLSKVNISSVNVGGIEVKCVDHVRDLGVLMENNLSFDRHIRKKCQTSHIQLRNLKRIRKHLSYKSTEILVHGLVHSHIDFCNGLFTDIPAYQIDRLQKVQNQAARIVANSSTYRPSVEILKSLHWLPVKARIMFKILVTVFRVVQGTAPIYLSSMFKRAQGHYRLRSSNEIRFTVPRTRTRAADRSIAVVGPKWWNALPNDIKTCTNETSFRSKLKTHLFEKFYN